MKYFIVGFLISISLNFFLFNKKDKPYQFLPIWETSISQALNKEIQQPQKNSPYFSIKTGNSFIHINHSGNIIFKKNFSNDSLFSLSDSGKFYAKYSKVGNNVEFFNSAGFPFWKKDSREYPIVSPNGKIIILAVSDLNNIRGLDFNGNEIIAPISSRICTNVVFSKNNDYTAIGFLNGNYYVFTSKGKLLLTNINEKLPPVKSMYLSKNGKFLSIHYGNTESDYLKVINIENKSSKSFRLPTEHFTQTALFVDDNGKGIMVNNDKLHLFDIKNDKLLSLSIIKQVPGQANITRIKDFYLVAYRGEKSTSCFLIVNDDGIILKDKVFSNEKYLYAMNSGNIILLKGEKNLYCWSFDL